MKSDLVRWLLDIDLIPKGSESLRLAWERPWPSWWWVILFIASGLFAIWSYSRLVGWRPGRGLLAATRFVMILLVLILISGPVLELPRETVEEDWVLILADRSASMTIADVPGAESTDEAMRRTREEQLRQTIQDHAAVLHRLDGQRHVVWMGFHLGAFNLEKPRAAPNEGGGEIDAREFLPELGEPTGRRTQLAEALEQALQRAAARPVSGVVVLSDGRTDSPPTRALVRRFQADAVPLFSVPLGSSEPLGDLALRRVDAPRRAFVQDKVPVVIEIDQLGSPADGAAATLRLIEAETGEELASADLTQDQFSEPVTLTAEPDFAGEATWQVILEPRQHDLVTQNNSKSFRIELIDRPLRVLYVEGYPRWEYRYVKNLLVREPTIDSSVMLISADRDFAQEGNTPITRLPRSPEEFAVFDVIVLGDVPATFFSPDQLEMIRDHVADRGAGLIWIAGERYTPVTYAGSALSDLLPMRGSLDLPQIGEPVTMQPTLLANQLGVLLLSLGEEVGWPNSLSDPSAGWPQLHSAQRIEPGQLKPAVEVLAHTVREFSGAHLPLVLSMRYGAGHCVYVATDDIWRWRYGRGELLPEQFWLQMIRMLGRESLDTAGRQAVVAVNPRRVTLHQPLHIELRVLDSQLLESPRATIQAVLETEDGQRLAEIELRRLGDDEDRFTATYVPEVPGSLRVRIADSTIPGLNQLSLSAPVEVQTPDEELRRPETDHDLLAELSAATGGRVIQPDELDQLPEVLPNRSVRTINPLREPIWDSPLAFILALALLTFEWIGRKMIRLA